MDTDAALLRLVWLASPALPVGGFSYSEGLEAAVEHGLVRDEQSAGDWLVDQLHLTLARGDLAVVAAVARDPRRAAELDAWVRQTRETGELRQQGEQMGKSLADWQRSVGWVAEGTVGWVAEGTPALDRGSAGVASRTQPTAHTYPVAFALAAHATGAAVRPIALTYAFAWSENMMQAAIKAVPLGQSAGQRILKRLAGDIPSAVDHALALGDDGRQSFTPMLAILSARHEIQYSRLFRS
ncbi:urease accessory protein UreF [Ramlibacter cellulosilyticus]|nr:urease accessory UreF family protein [Ramlibacter cellulosilyticus]